ncbi:MAG: hydroxymethylglutaryl-CoA reductase, degradative [Candidatus Methanolliviera hydrocarbonicum]|uniref:3-hydroxy-3-methylglutaryl coenzyme A reductase n=1 Tax=Candidatus Methanolliviera hydrocarbonicum TaxID=2491085 RepID=A0A520KV51_9EURY|nr:MAG: hydroxymethylglutaryl-CoA reductase, degradative [Candidatus Methanolliviera hydrocarbonicum]
MRKDSRIPGFYKLGVEKRISTVKEFVASQIKDLRVSNRRFEASSKTSGLSNEDVKALTGTISFEDADRMIENVIGVHPLPLGIATNFLINDKDYLIPMAIEEPSVVAAASNAAKMARVKGGFHAISDEPIMIGQIQLITKNPALAKCKILNEKERILKIANREDPLLLKLGGGAKDLSARVLPSQVIIHLLVNVKDAMGANAVNTMVEAVAPTIEEIGVGKVLLRIISNLATHRLARAYAIFDKDAIGGEEVADGIIMATEFANSDPFRCATHNKGIMNGIDALAIATGNDFRAVESGAHAYASLGGYHSLTTYEKTEDGDLSGSIELPLLCGIIGGATSSSFNKVSLKILNVHSAQELACVGASLGLAQNFAALRALVSEGIQKGHMKLHAKNIAAMAGAKGELIDRVAERLIRDGSIRMDRAREILEEMQPNL